MSTVTVFEVPRKRQPEEFRQIFEQYYDLVYSTAYGILRRAEDAEDVVQSVFYYLLRAERLPDLTKNPKGYFYRAAVNLSLRVIRTRKRYALTGDIEAFEGLREAPDSARSEELDQRLWAAIAELSEPAAQIVILRYIRNCSIEEIAKLVGTTRSTVAVSLFRSRARLKKLIRVSQSGGDS